MHVHFTLGFSVHLRSFVTPHPAPHPTPGACMPLPVINPASHPTPCYPPPPPPPPAPWHRPAAGKAVWNIEYDMGSFRRGCDHQPQYGMRTVYKASPHACLHACPPARLPAACPPTYLPAYPPACLPARLPARPPACMPACQWSTVHPLPFALCNLHPSPVTHQPPSRHPSLTSHPHVTRHALALQNQELTSIRQECPQSQDPFLSPSPSRSASPSASTISTPLAPIPAAATAAPQRPAPTPAPAAALPAPTSTPSISPSVPSPGSTPASIASQQPPQPTMTNGWWAPKASDGLAFQYQLSAEFNPRADFVPNAKVGAYLDNAKVVAHLDCVLWGSLTRARRHRCT